MALQKSTVIWLVIALMAGGISAITLSRPKPPEVAPLDTQKPLFIFSRQDIQGLTIQNGQELLAFVKTEADPEQWQMLEPQRTNASEAAIAFLTNLLIDRRNYLSFEVTAAQFDTYGLVNPYSTITIELAGQSPQTLTLGNANFDNTQIYGRVNDELRVWVLPGDFRNAVTRDITEWQEVNAEPEVSN